MESAMSDDSLFFLSVEGGRGGGVGAARVRDEFRAEVLKGPRRRPFLFVRSRDASGTGVACRYRFSNRRAARSL